MNKPPIREGKRLYNSSKEAATEIDRLTAEVERLMNGQYDTYAAAREEYRKKIDEQAKEIERLTLNGIHTCSDECQRPLCVARRENARLREALTASERAISEYYRYWTGGETRGSYDGKPERQGLWEAQRKARAALEGK